MTRLLSLGIYLVLVIASVINSGLTECLDNTIDDALQCDYGNREKWGLCLVYGDPHFVTIDGLQYRFRGTCEYILAQYCKKKDGTFQVTSSFEQKGNNPDVTMLKSVTINVDGYIIKITKLLKSVGTVTVNGDDKTGDLPFEITVDDLEVWIFSDGNSIYVRIRKNGKDLLRVCFDLYYCSLKLHFSVDFESKLCGMCGYYDGKESNDQKSKSNKRSDPSISGGSGGTGSSGSTGGSRRRRRRALSISSGDQSFGNRWLIEGSCGDASGGSSGGTGGSSGNSGGSR